MKTTLNTIKATNPGTEAFQKLLAYLGKAEADDEPLDLRAVLTSNGAEDTLSVMKLVVGHEEGKKKVEDAYCSAKTKFDKQFDLLHSKREKMLLAFDKKRELLREKRDKTLCRAVLEALV